MSANLNFLSNGFTISGSSGLAFFGSAFGNSVKVGQYQNTTYISNAAGTAQGPLVNNTLYSPGSGAVNSQAPTGLIYIPNYLSTLNIQFSNDTPVKTQNVKVYIYDSVNFNNPASGVTTQIVEIVHPDVNQTPTGSGSTSWTIMSGVVGAPNSYNLFSSPGQSGLYNNTTSTRPDSIHNNYLLLSCAPNSVGSKQFGLYCSLEYL